MISPDFYNGQFDQFETWRRCVNFEVLFLVRAMGAFVTVSSGGYKEIIFRPLAKRQSVAFTLKD